MTERVLSQVQAVEMVLCEEFTVWQFATKPGGEIRKALHADR